MSRERIAIVGTGISGMASAWFLSRDHDVTLFEKDDRVGGHSHTVMVPEGTEQIPVDTGFMVYNEVTYPLLTRLFRELDVITKPTSMSFSVQHVNEALEFNGGSLNLLFGQRRNLGGDPRDAAARATTVPRSSRGKSTSRSTARSRSRRPWAQRS